MRAVRVASARHLVTADGVPGGGTAFWRKHGPICRADSARQAATYDGGPLSTRPSGSPAWAMTAFARKHGPSSGVDRSRHAATNDGTPLSRATESGPLARATNAAVSETRTTAAIATGLAPVIAIASSPNESRRRVEKRAFHACGNASTRSSAVLVDLTNRNTSARLGWLATKGGIRATHPFAPSRLTPFASASRYSTSCRRALCKGQWHMLDQVVMGTTDEPQESRAC
jgi:hypothetical protein